MSPSTKRRKLPIIPPARANPITFWYVSFFSFFLHGKGSFYWAPPTSQSVCWALRIRNGGSLVSTSTIRSDDPDCVQYGGSSVKIAAQRDTRKAGQEWSPLPGWLCLRWALEGAWESTKWARTFQTEEKITDVSHVPTRYLEVLLKTSHVITKATLGGRYYHSHFTDGEIETVLGNCPSPFRWLNSGLLPVLFPLDHAASPG